jgi:hypothetical protein
MIFKLKHRPLNGSSLLNAADNGEDLRQHVLVLVLVVHVHAGQEHVVGRMGVDPAQQNNILPNRLDNIS